MRPEYLHVTSILPQINPTANPEPYFVRGSHVHRACELLDTVGLDWGTVHHEWEGYIRAWEAFKRDIGAEILHVECPVESKRYGYCGKLDRIIKVHGKRFLVDIKTGPPTATIGMQTAAYSWAAEEMGESSITRRGVVQLCPDGTYRWTASSTPGQKLFSPTDLSYFLAFLKARQWELRHGLWSPPNREEESA